MQFNYTSTRLTRDVWCRVIKYSTRVRSVLGSRVRSNSSQRRRASTSSLGIPRIDRFRQWKFPLYAASGNRFFRLRRKSCFERTRQRRLFSYSALLKLSTWRSSSIKVDFRLLRRVTRSPLRRFRLALNAHCDASQYCCYGFLHMYVTRYVVEFCREAALNSMGP